VHGCPGTRTGGEEDVHGRKGGGAWVMGRARMGGDWSTHNGSLHQFQGVIVLLGAPFPECLNEYTRINITCPFHIHELKHNMQLIPRAENKYI
jgi:hypothetical protein